MEGNGERNNGGQDMLLRVCAYKEGWPIPHQSILDACCQPVGDLLDAVSGIFQGPLSR